MKALRRTTNEFNKRNCLAVRATCQGFSQDLNRTTLQSGLTAELLGSNLAFGQIWTVWEVPDDTLGDSDLESPHCEDDLWKVIKKQRHCLSPALACCSAMTQDS